jgi:hypothetical protein
VAFRSTAGTTADPSLAGRDDAGFWVVLEDAEVIERREVDVVQRDVDGLDVRAGDVSTVFTQRNL